MRRDWPAFQTPQVQKAKAKFPGYLTTAEIANRIGLSEYTIRKWRRENVLTPTKRVKTGKSEVCLYSPAALEKARLLTKTRKPGITPTQKEND